MIPLLFAREILETAIGLGILEEYNGGVLIYRVASDIDPEDFPEGWYIDDKDTFVFSIANEEEAILELKPALVEKGYQFSERQKFWENFLDTKAPILRIPATYEQRVC